MVMDTLDDVHDKHGCSVSPTLDGKQSERNGVLGKQDDLVKRKELRPCASFSVFHKSLLFKVPRGRD